jgi:hypothetical protein
LVIPFSQKDNGGDIIETSYVAQGLLAIDQGPILLMIENYRSRLLWDLFMANPEIQPMMDSIGFVHSPNFLEEVKGPAGQKRSQMLSAYPNPAAGGCKVSFMVNHTARVRLEVYDMTGSNTLPAG